jgi:hypothetical protein
MSGWDCGNPGDTPERGEQPVQPGRPERPFARCVDDRVACPQLAPDRRHCARYQMALQLPSVTTVGYMELP